MEILDIHLLAESLKIKKTSSLERPLHAAACHPAPRVSNEAKASWTLKTCLNRQCRGGGVRFPGGHLHIIETSQLSH